MTERKRVIEGEEYTASNVVKKFEKAVYYHARRLKGTHELEDIIGEGFYALLRAFNTYDPEKNDSWIKHVHASIRYHILKVIRKPSKGPYVPHGTVYLAWHIRRENLEDSSAIEIHKALNEPVAHIERSLTYLRTTINSFDVPIEDGDSLYDLVQGTNHDTTIHMVNEFINTLEPEEKIVLEGTYKGYTQTEIGKPMGLSQAQVSRIRKTIQRKYECFESGEVYIKPIPRPNRKKGKLNDYSNLG